MASAHVAAGGARPARSAVAQQFGDDGHEQLRSQLRGLGALHVGGQGTHAVIEAADESVPGRYQFPMRLADLIPAEQDDPGLE
ncbi:hypothetical protein [Nocardia farcinica]|uniref:hypothetical protein n=1 Tax=Nocardia farcinica TaxID=37329 RepID=UPI0034DACF3D